MKLRVYSVYSFYDLLTHLLVHTYVYGLIILFTPINNIYIDQQYTYIGSEFPLEACCIYLHKGIIPIALSGRSFLYGLYFLMF